MSAALAMPAPSGVSVRPVSGKADKNEFIGFQWECYRNHPAWVPPLRMERRDFLDEKKNPFFLHASVQLFLARRDGRVVGRIAAIEDRNYNKFHSAKVCNWGLFECADDVEVARALFDAVRTWARERGLVSLLGPMNFSTNYDCGMLLDAFDLPPFLLTTYNPPYYPALVEACGQTKAKDLFGWSLPVQNEVPERVQRLAEKFRKREGLTVRPIDLSDLEGEIDKIKRIYNDAWEQNWGAVPMTDEEFHHMAKDMKQLVVPQLLLIAEVKGDPVAFAMTLPDVNRALAKLPDGKLFPFGLFKLLWHMKRVKGCRLVALGIKKGFRKRGIDAVLYNDTQKNAQKLGYTDGEISWTLEDNDLINRAIELMGAKKYKTYRVYEGAV